MILAMDLYDSMRESLIRAGREAARVRFIGEVQARLVALRLARRSLRDDLVQQTLELYRRNAIQHPELAAACRELDLIDQDIDRLQAAVGRARGGDAYRPKSPTVTDITRHEPPEA
jgi:hypothetical protein